MASNVKSFKKVNKVNSSPQGVSGVVISGGYLHEFERNADLAGVKKYETYSDIVGNVSIVAASVRFFLNLIAKAEWTVSAADDTPQAIEIAEKMERIITEMRTPWHRVVRRTAMARFYGFSLQEWTAKKFADGTVGIRDIAPRPQVTIERWDVETSTGVVLGAWQRDPNSYKELYIPREKLVYYVDDSLNDSPEGLGLFRHLAEPAARLARYEQLEGFGFETDLRGIPVARIPYAHIRRMLDENEISQEEALAMTAPVENFMENHIRQPDLALGLDSAVYTTDDEKESPSGNKMFDLEILSGGSTSFGDVAGAIERINHEMARVVGTEHLLLGQTRGTQALSEDKSHNFAMIVDSTLQEIEQVYEHDLCRAVMAMNGWPLELCPSMSADKMRYKDVRELTTALKDLSAAALAPDDPANEQIRNLLGLDTMPRTADVGAALMAALADDDEEDIEEDIEEDTDLDTEQ